MGLVFLASPLPEVASRPHDSLPGASGELKEPGRRPSGRGSRHGQGRGRLSQTLPEGRAGPIRRKGAADRGQGIAGAGEGPPPRKSHHGPQGGRTFPHPGDCQEKGSRTKPCGRNDRACQEPCQARSCHRHTLAVRALGRQSHSCKKLAQTGQGNSMQGEPHTHL